MNKQQQMAQAQAVDKLSQIIMGLTSERNVCWPCAKPWTKKERDEVILGLAREARALLTATEDKQDLDSLANYVAPDIYHNMRR